MKAGFSPQNATHFMDLTNLTSGEVILMGGGLAGNSVGTRVTLNAGLSMLAANFSERNGKTLTWSGSEIGLRRIKSAGISIGSSSAFIERVFARVTGAVTFSSTATGVAVDSSNITVTGVLAADAAKYEIVVVTDTAKYIGMGRVTANDTIVISVINATGASSSDTVNVVAYVTKRP